MHFRYRFTCPNGGIGRREGLKILCPLKTCRFEPGFGHINGVSGIAWTPFFLCPAAAPESDSRLTGEVRWLRGICRAGGRSRPGVFPSPGIFMDTCFCMRPGFSPLGEGGIPRKSMVSWRPSYSRIKTVESYIFYISAIIYGYGLL